MVIFLPQKVTHAAAHSYKKVPRWWYVVVSSIRPTQTADILTRCGVLTKNRFVALLVVAYAMAQATDYTGHSHFSWWALTVVSARAHFGCSVGRVR